MRLKKGFSLVELLVVVLIIGALAAIVIPRVTGGANTAKINACKTNVDIINTQLELSRSETGLEPDSVDSLISNRPDCFPDGPPQCPFGHKYEIDPGTQRVREHDH